MPTPLPLLPVPSWSVDQPHVPHLTLERMRMMGGSWAAYQSQEIGYGDLGQLRFMAFGGDRLHAIPLKHFPSIMRYVLVGVVDLKTGRVVEERKDSP